jgi:hypothetical protein
VTLSFYLVYFEGHITRKFILKTKKKSMDKCKIACTWFFLTSFVIGLNAFFPEFIYV